MSGTTEPVPTLVIQPQSPTPEPIPPAGATTEALVPHFLEAQPLDITIPHIGGRIP